MRADRLKQLIKQKGFSNVHIADTLNVAPNTVWRWTAGHAEPNDETKKALAEMLGVTVGYLMGDPDSITAKEVASGVRLRQARKDIGISVIELARRVGVSPSTIESFEFGSGKPEDEMLIKLADALGCDPSDLLEKQRGVVVDGEFFSESDKMYARVMRRLAQINPDIAVFMRDIDNEKGLGVDDLQGLADGVALASGKTSKDIEERVKKKSPHGEV